MKNLSNGVIDQTHLGYESDFLYRVSIKALIRDETGKVLVVKETGRTGWDMPGGGMNHNESLKDAIARELHEEVSMNGDFTYRALAAEEPEHLQRANIWQIRLVFEVKPFDMTFSAGEDGDEVTFIDPVKLKDSDNGFEKKVYDYAKLAEC